jgi:putative salt-induced outer membrane protein YdiY
MDTSVFYGLGSYTWHILDAQQLRRGVTFLKQSRGTWEQDMC